MVGCPPCAFGLRSSRTAGEIPMGGVHGAAVPGVPIYFESVTERMIALIVQHFSQCANEPHEATQDHIQPQMSVSRNGE